MTESYLEAFSLLLFDIQCCWLGRDVPHDGVLPRRQSVWSPAFLEAEWIPMLTDCTSVSIALSQLVQGHPQGLLQLLGGRSNAPMTRWKGCSACNNLTAGIHKSNLTNLKLLSQTDKNDIGDGVGCLIKWQRGLLVRFSIYGSIFAC